ncbi:AAA family ATPase [bacterium]|nr:AAA family ATPase [bacterium]
MPLNRILEQPRARRILESMVTGERLPHALLFWGPPGVGKSASAIELARWLNCHQELEGPCGQCESCVKMATLEHPHFSYQMPLPRKALADADTGELSQSGAEELSEILRAKGADLYASAKFTAAQFILIGQIRSLIRWANVKSFSQKPRIALIDHADALKEEAGNALLKLLEEPPPEFILILTAETPEDVLPTLLSRCQPVEFDRLSDSIIDNELEKRGIQDVDTRKRLAHLSSGNLTRAIDFASKPETMEELMALGIDIVRHSLGKNPLQLNPHLESWNALTADQRTLVLEIITAWLRDAALLSAWGETSLPRLIHTDRIELLRKFVTNCPRADFTEAARQIETARFNIERNVLPPLVFTNLARNIYRTIYATEPV